jgi:hypothetical protein
MVGGVHQCHHLSSDDNTIYDFLPMHCSFMETQRLSTQQQWTRAHRRVIPIHTKVLVKEMEVVLHFLGASPVCQLYAHQGVHPDWNSICG